MNLHSCQAKLTYRVGADSDHEMDATGIEGYPSVDDGYKSATLAWCANRPWAHAVFCLIYSIK